MKNLDLTDLFQLNLVTCLNLIQNIEYKSPNNSALIFRFAEINLTLVLIGFKIRTSIH